MEVRILTMNIWCVPRLFLAEGLPGHLKCKELGEGLAASASVCVEPACLKPADAGLLLSSPIAGTELGEECVAGGAARLPHHHRGCSRAVTRACMQCTS